MKKKIKNYKSFIFTYNGQMFNIHASMSCFYF